MPHNVNSNCTRRSGGNSAIKRIAYIPHVGEVEASFLDGDAMLPVLVARGIDNILG